jgi:hypothetical protein
MPSPDQRCAFRRSNDPITVKIISFFDDPSHMAECSFITDREAKILTGILAAIIIVPALWMARDVLTAPQTMIPVLIGVPLIAGLIWYGWGRKSENWILYAAVLAAALALPVGALLMVLVGWIPVALGIKPIVVGAAFWTAFALVILRQITLMRKKEN